MGAGFKEKPVWKEAEEGRAAYCQHNRESQVHCCLCHDGFIFDGMQHDPRCPYYGMLAGDDEQAKIDELAEVIEKFMAGVPGEDERPWDSVQMAAAIIKAGYKKNAGGDIC